MSAVVPSVRMQKNGRREQHRQYQPQHRQQHPRPAV
jgi:hypothetical protein